MSKKEEAAKEESKNVEQPSPIEMLTSQLRDYREKAEYFKVMALKAEGALDILTQMEEAKGESK